MPATQTTKLTATQFFQLGEDPPGVRFELVDGEIEMSPSPTTAHAHCIQMLSVLLGTHVLHNQLGVIFGDLDTQLDEYFVRRPDLLYFSEARRHLVGRDRLRGLPDLAVEVVSPSSGKTDRQTKFGEYEKAGIAHYWIIDPEQRTMVAYSLDDGRYRQQTEGGGDDTLHAPPFTELDLPLGRLWME